MSQRFAAIDTGTNTILMLIAEIDEDSGFKVVRDEHRIARLGEDLEKTGVIGTAAIRRACKIFDEYAQICRDENVNHIEIVCTSALRRARNSKEVITEFGKHIKADIKIISGEEEAFLSFIGTVKDDSDSTVIDIGGGSTEFIRGKGKNIIIRKSVETGAVRCTERFIAAHPPSETTLYEIRKRIRSQLNDALDIMMGERLYAVAGTPVTIASVLNGYKSFDEEVLNNFILKKNDIEEVLSIFISNDLNYLINELGIHNRRADVITAGTLILLESLEALNTDSVVVSTKGLRYGLMKSINNKILV